MFVLEVHYVRGCVSICIYFIISYFLDEDYIIVFFVLFF